MINKKEDLRIVYMGTPDFAVESLRQLVENGYNVVGVITVPDKPIGRHGSVLQASPVKQYAESKHIPLLQPEKLKDEEFLSQLRAWKADLQIVVAFRMLPEVVWDMPRLGTFNLHGSLLPQYRGAAPINWAVINGDTETGVTTFFLTHEIDTGKIIRQRHIPIADTDDAGMVHDKLMAIGGGVVLETVDLILEDKVEAIEQEHFFQEVSELRPAPKIFKDTCRIEWNQPLKRIYDFIRGLSPYPAAWTEFVAPDGSKQVLKIYQTEKHPATHSLPVGTLVTSNKKQLDVAVPDGYIRLLSVQLSGKKRMNVSDFLNGFKQTEGYTVL
ncbi:methionyl-tRNA formyltransferase [Parabacteroides sp. PF5-5]|uniref:methionyl-tRNA formyltransferase n=1 Tax=unclassified Parabacteroides TaxID=2649774 RepID=UPI002476B81C|nr:MULTISPECIES: methionyl-tRNA formyltransferase [unclassified Parabacteroides]MDH6303868.1 methionyl-tRNA formyltransferase [Parabacteroides sp. PH5-39]MDH6314485.1 methionyl-tRNA formyltransferase [Parabacteroides sp. PF5-13]MDH6318450.1 methionyl-tRNA formyltransferase [Parabacteroides sp. PH5-13]MDH6322257.1 methionyl-tRNA formyltransferase [Parabacteroides sp. PH5-8]MDH6325663.1 methionyl-tRNA formyltransferase [Parabacteroides sp. PH5-41]